MTANAALKFHSTYQRHIRGRETKMSFNYLTKFPVRLRRMGANADFRPFALFLPDDH